MNDPERYCDTTIVFPPGVTITEKKQTDDDHWTHAIGGSTPIPRLPRKKKPIQSPVTAGRNDRCPCGSGRKYKRCCRSK